MIKEQDLVEAIAECQGEKNPNANTCIKLAAYYTILDHIRGTDINVLTNHSFASEPTERVMYDSGSEFSEAVDGKSYDAVLVVIDELMEVLQVLMPKLYYATLDKLRD